MVAVAAHRLQEEADPSSIQTTMTEFRSPLTVGYWSIRGLGAPLRMMCSYADVKYIAQNHDCTPKEDGGFDLKPWFDDKVALKERNPLMNLPYILDGEAVVCQTNACFAYLGRKFGLLGSNEMETSQCEQLLCEVYDLRGSMVGFAYSANKDKDVAKEAAQKVADNVTGRNGSLQKFELWLAREKSNGASGTFLVGNKASAPDFHLWEMLHQYKEMSLYYGLAPILANFPCLDQFYASFAALPGNAKYLSSALAKLPFNNKGAGFGATPGLGPWVPGQSYDWADTSGEY